MRSAILVLALASRAISLKDVPDTNPLGLDPALAVTYSDEELAEFNPPVLNLTMGPAPTDLFTNATNLINIVTAEAPVIA